MRKHSLTTNPSPFREDGFDRKILNMDEHLSVSRLYFARPSNLKETFAYRLAKEVSERNNAAVDGVVVSYLPLYTMV